MQILTVILVLACAVPAWALEPSGEIYGSIGYEWDRENKEGEFASIRTGLRLALEDELEELGKLHFSTKGWLDLKQSDGSIALDQLWLKGYSGDFDYQVGRQLISWGTADGFNPTNYFARLNSSALLSGDLQGEAVWAGRAEYYAPSWSATGVLIPIFAPQKIDDLMRKMISESHPQGALLLRGHREGQEARFGSSRGSAAG